MPCSGDPHGPDGTLGPESPGASSRSAGPPWVTRRARRAAAWEAPQREPSSNDPSGRHLCPASLSLAS